MVIAGVDGDEDVDEDEVEEDDQSDDTRVTQTEVRGVSRGVIKTRSI